MQSPIELNQIDVDMMQMRIVSYEPKYSRGTDDIDDPLPDGSFYAHVNWEHRTVTSRGKPKVIYTNHGEGDLYFYKPTGREWQYEFRFQYDDGRDEFRNGTVSSNINCDSFMRWFVDYINYGEKR